MQRGVESATATSGEALSAAHAELLRDKAFQFDRASYEPPKPPDWLHWIGDLLKSAGPLLQWVFWIGVGILVLLILYGLGRELLRLGAPRPKATPVQAQVEPEWRPAAEAARDLLAAADALAAQGRFAEAAHLILLRSVEDIEAHRPRSVRPALTTREIASLSALPAAARPAFGKIARLVERSLFGGAPVDAADFADCRRDYEAFALPNGWAA